ncbi:MAG TPA: rod shape-determining protein MreD [Dehalococcoidia bacterium]|nr:rod shape-determining protein MreD [Dehalococcoidia bacterium]
MRIALGALLSLAVALLGYSALPSVRPLGVQPDLVLLLAVCWAVAWSPGEGLLLAIAAGTLSDLLGTRPVGLSVLGALPALALAALGQATVVQASFPSALVAVGLGTLAQHILYLLAYTIMGEGPAWGDGLVRGALPAAIVNLLWTPLVLVLLRGLRAVLGPRAAGPRLGG